MSSYRFFDPWYARVSVIVPSFRAGTTLARTLESLQDQEEPGDYEVIVVDCSNNDEIVRQIQSFPMVRLIRLKQRAYPGKARNTGVAAATGQMLAFTDADCIVPRNWIQNIRRAHQSGLPIAGGPVANANPESWIGWVYFFCKFSPWLPNKTPRRVREIPTTALTMPRWVFEQWGPFREEGYSSDSVFNWTVARQLEPPLLFPGLEVQHYNFTRLGHVLLKLLVHAQDYARVRSWSEGWSRWRCLLYALAGVALPALLFARATLNVWKAGVYQRQFIMAAPLTLCGFMAWSVGEIIGYARAGGRTC